MKFYPLFFWSKIVSKKLFVYQYIGGFLLYFILKKILTKNPF